MILKISLLRNFSQHTLTVRTEDRTDGHKPDGAIDRADGGGTRRNRTDERRESDVVGQDDEQHPTQRGGISTDHRCVL